MVRAPQVPPQRRDAQPAKPGPGQAPRPRQEFLNIIVEGDRVPETLPAHCDGKVPIDGLYVNSLLNFCSRVSHDRLHDSGPEVIVPLALSVLACQILCEVPVRRTVPVMRLTQNELSAPLYSRGVSCPVTYWWTRLAMRV